MDLTKLQLEKLDEKLVEILYADIINIHDFSVRAAVSYVHDMISIYREPPEEIYRKINDLAQLDRNFGTKTEYTDLFEVLFGKFENLPLYINTPGFNVIAIWRLSLTGQESL